MHDLDKSTQHLSKGSNTFPYSNKSQCESVVDLFHSTGKQMDTSDTRRQRHKETFDS